MGIDLKQVFLALLVAWTFSRPNRKKLPCPPGPKGLPFIGPVMQMPSSFEWVEFWRWGKVWGMFRVC
jgi:hypothetical protein